MNLIATITFDHGGIIKKNKGDHFDVSDELGKRLLKIGVAELNKVTFKKIKVKENGNTIDKAKDKDK